MAYTSGHVHTHGHTSSDLFHASWDWTVSQIKGYRRRRQLARAEAELRGFSDELLHDIGLSRGEIHNAVWNGRSTYRRSVK